MNNYINTKTNGQYIVLIKGETQEKTKTTKNEMIDCILEKKPDSSEPYQNPKLF